MSGEEMNRVRSTLIRIVENAMDDGILNFLVIGGNAVIAHGVPRFTRDVYFVIPESDYLRWRKFLERLDYHSIHGSPAFAQFESSKDSKPRVDLMLVNQSTWENLSEEAWIYHFTEDRPTRIASPQHLIAMKLRACLSPHRREDAQDWSDIVHLCLTHEFDPGKDETFSAFVLRFGGTELRGRLVDEIASRRGES